MNLDVIVVGPCAAGKSSLVARLRAAGIRARSVSQEHSYVPYMWQRHRPDVLIYLDLRLETLRHRRRPSWTQQMLDEQHRRLAHARTYCDLYLPTDLLSAEQVAQQATRFLSTFRRDEARPLPAVHPLMQAFQRDDPA
ncbi:MAG TPA: hypothetical protein VM536_03605 [Chloroflexia bacterium]|nr:hypothetical protein [Chloroflexia bacterium]